MRVTTKELLDKYESQTDQYNVFSVSESRTNYLQLNPHGPFDWTDDSRKAVFLAINPQEIIDIAYGNEDLARVPNSLFNPDLQVSDPSFTAYEQNLEEAIILAESSGLKGATLKYVYNADRANMEQVATVIQQQLAQINVNVEVEGLDSNTFFTTFFALSFDSGLETTWDLGTNGWDSERGTSGGQVYSYAKDSRNAWGWSEDINNLAVLANSATTEEEVKDLYSEIHDKQMEECWEYPISFFSFAVIYFSPGDISSMYINEEMSEEQKEDIRQELGLDGSLVDQYVSWGKKAIIGNLGISLANRLAVTPQILNRLPATFLLMGTALVFSIVLAIPLGLLAGFKRNSMLDKIVSALSYIGMSIPSFWLAMVLIIIFSTKLQILPSFGIRTVGFNSTLDLIKHMVMPVTTLCLSNLAIFIRYIRSNTISEFEKEYVVTAKAKGTTEKRVMSRHVLKNVLLPIITLVGMNLPSLVAGSFIIETVFGWPGIGSLAMSAIGSRDYPVIMAYVMLTGIILVIGNLLADILYTFVDPRIKLGADN